MNEVLLRWNAAPAEEAVAEILACCGSRAWATQLVESRPIGNTELLLTTSNRIWLGLSPADWLEAFRSHPRIGETTTKDQIAAQSAGWSRQEQSGVSTAEDRLKIELAAANRAYEDKFGHIFIVCATGKAASEILAILRRRMHNDGDTELCEAAEQQRQITQLRLKKWLTA